ncbi:MAG: O-antigen ligase family protein [Candidatus Caenarcaniphilales bacterium]|nr:O-antigen ligase family protein [Candidatus Caenarcaniphilales bacterium]
MAKILNSKIPLFVLCLIFACVSLPRYAGAEDKSGLAVLMAVFIAWSFLSFAYEFFQKWKSLSSNSFVNLHCLRAVLESYKPNLIDYSVLALLLVALFATCASPFFKESLSGLIKYSFYFFFYVAIRFVVKSRNDCLALFACASIGLLWANLEGLKQAMFGAEALATWEDPNIPLSETFSRVYSSFLNPNLYGAYLLGLWPLSLLFAFLSFLSSKERGNKLVSYVLSLFFGLMVLVSLYLAFQTGSRGAWLSLGVQLAFIAFCIIRYTKSFWAGLLFSLGGFGAGLYLISKPTFYNRLLTIFSSYEHSSNSFRLNVWKACLQMIADNPIFGIGPGSKSFYLGYGVYMDAKYSALGAYSLFLELAVEMGFLGIAALLFLIFSLSKSGIEVIKSTKPSKGTENKSKKLLDLFVVLAILCSLIGLLFNGLFDIVILRPQIQIILWLLVANLSFYQSLIRSESRQ